MLQEKVRLTPGLSFILITVALDMLALGIMIPVLPRLVRTMIGGDTGEAARLCGRFASAWSLMQFLCSPLVGSLSDRFGRRPIAVLSNLGQGLDYIMMALAPSVRWLFVGRMISGVTAASVSVGGAYIADILPPEKRARAFGYLGASFSLGFIVGPALGGWLGQFGDRVPFYVAGAFSMINAVYGYFVLPESLPPEKRASWSWKTVNPLASFKLLGRHPVLLGLGVVAVLANTASEALPNVAVLYTDYRYGWDSKTVGTVLGVASVLSVLVQVKLVEPLVSRFGEPRTLSFAMCCGTLGMVIYGLAPTGALYLVGLVPMGLWAAASPVHQSLMSRHIREDQQGALQGAQSSLWGVAGLIGPYMFTEAFAHSLDNPQGWVGSPFFIAAVMLLGAVALAERVLRDEKPAPVADA